MNKAMKRLYGLFNRLSGGVLGITIYISGMILLFGAHLSAAIALHGRPDGEGGSQAGTPLA